MNGINLTADFELNNKGEWIMTNVVVTAPWNIESKYGKAFWCLKEIVKEIPGLTIEELHNKLKLTFPPDVYSLGRHGLNDCLVKLTKLGFLKRVRMGVYQPTKTFTGEIKEKEKYIPFMKKKQYEPKPEIVKAGKELVESYVVAQSFVNEYNRMVIRNDNLEAENDMLKSKLELAGCEVIELEEKLKTIKRELPRLVELPEGINLSISLTDEENEECEEYED